MVSDGHDGDLIEVLDLAGDAPYPAEKVSRDSVNLVGGHQRNGLRVQRRER